MNNLNTVGNSKFGYSITWMYIAFTLVALLSCFLPEMAFAADSKNRFVTEDTKDLGGDFAAAGRYYWDLVMIPVAWITAIAAVVLYFTNYSQYMRTAAAVFLFAAFLDDVVVFLMKMGGVQI